ncbi:hypothetical protein L593_12190 [Salinarchaeum sp. Harcht-Bsk1]|nr:hypothetical protein L593_12190 [Salinarchaeum sp. Harcht-Bsk1]
MQANQDRLADIIAENEMTLRTFWNRLNHPNRDIQKYTGPDDVKDVLQNKHGSDYWKRLYFGWEVDTDQNANTIVEDTVEKLTDLDRLFHDPADGLDEMPV